MIVKKHSKAQKNKMWQTEARDTEQPAYVSANDPDADANAMIDAEAAAADTRNQAWYCMTALASCDPVYCACSCLPRNRDSSSGNNRQMDRSFAVGGMTQYHATRRPPVVP